MFTFLSKVDYRRYGRQHPPFSQVILPVLSSTCHLQQDNCVGLPASAGLSQSDLCDILPVTPEITPNALQRLPTHLEKFHDTDHCWNGQVTEKGVNPLVRHHGSDQPSLEMASAQITLGWNVLPIHPCPQGV